MKFGKIGTALTAGAIALSMPAFADDKNIDRTTTGGINTIQLDPKVLTEITQNYKDCIKSGLEAADNGDGTIDEEFFGYAKEECDEIAQLNTKMAEIDRKNAQLTASIINGAKAELGLK